jgi:PAS domain S-box-containing protein
MELEPVNILVVDDRPENVLALKAVLNNPDYHVVTASNGAEALKRILKYEFAVVLLDVLMPAMDGFETARLIFERDASRDVPIIFLTAANSDVGSMRAGYEVGAVDYLIKPIEPEIVRAKVAVFVDLFRKTKQIQRQELALREAERVQSQRTLSEREAEYEATFEKAAVGIAHVSTQGRCLRINQKFCDIVGFSKTESLELTLETISHPDDVATQAEGLKRLLEGTLQSFRGEQRFLHKTGRILRIDLTVSLLRDAGGAPLKFITIVEDATERKRGEEGQQVLAETSKLLLNSIDFSPTFGRVAQCVVPVLADFCVIELLGRDTGSPSELAVAHADAGLATRLRELMGRTPVKGWRGTWAIANQQAELIPEITPVLLASWAASPTDLAQLEDLDLVSGIIVPLKVRGKLLGSIAFLSATLGRRYTFADVAIAEDLAQRVSLAVENARLYKDAQDAIAARDEFLSIASHELRTPLTPLQIQLQRMLGVRGKPGIEEMPRDQVRNIVQRSAVQVNRLAALIDSLLDVSRITAGRLSLQLEEVNLGELATEVTSRFSDEAAAANSPISLETSGPVIARCDPLRVEQVLANLVANAIKYGDGKPITIRVSAEADNGLVTVTDRGIGIPPEQQPAIFDRFERGAAARNYAGLGLGLYIARQIIDAHHGSIHVQSTPGAGSMFTVRIPLASAQTAARPKTDPDAGAGKTQESTVLLVEDDDDIRTCVAELLRTEGYQVLCAANGEEGLKQLAAVAPPPDVIVLDLMMPVLDGLGFSAAQQKRPEWSQIPVVVLSGDGVGDERRRAAIPRASFLKKPVDVNVLLKLVDQLCNRPAQA